MEGLSGPTAKKSNCKIEKKLNGRGCLEEEKREDVKRET
jgi:hypothetical protein